MQLSSIAVAAALLVAATIPVAAQDSTECRCRPHAVHTPSEFELRSSGGISFIQSRPLGGLADNIGFGYGAYGNYEFRLDHAGYLSLRGDLGILGYGHESKRVPFSSTVGGRVQVKVVTQNSIVPMAIGPQLAWPTGPVRPYVNAGVGGQLFFTSSSVQGTNFDEDIASTTNQWDWTPTWIAGGGVYLPLYAKNVSVALDLGVQYYNGGHARYLRPGSIQDLPDSQIRITPLESDTRLALVHIGVRIGR